MKLPIIQIFQPSVISWELGYRSRYSDWLRAGRPRDQSSSTSRGKIFILSSSSGPVLGPTQPPIQWVPGAVPRG
jgi:hypothetical protein